MHPVITINPATARPPVVDTVDLVPPPKLPAATSVKLEAGTEEADHGWNGITIMTDPNFLHAGDHVHLGPGVTGTRKTNPAVELNELPPLDLILLSHYHADHFDQEVEERLRRDLPIVTTPHAKSHLEQSSNPVFDAVTALDHWESSVLRVEGGGEQALKITAMPGKHVPPGGMLEMVNEWVKAVPPVNGWMLELGEQSGGDETFSCGYRIYITGDTLLIDELNEIPKRYADVGKEIDLMLMHLGGTTIPGPSLPLLMVTMDADMGVKMLQLIDPRLSIPVHYDDYDVFMSSLDDFKTAVAKAGLTEKLIYLDRGEEYRFKVHASEER